MKTLLRLTVVPLICLALCLCLSSAAFGDDVSFTIPNRVTVIEEEVFAGCTNMKRVLIPEGVKEIADGAFSGCTNLWRVYFSGTLEQLDRIRIGSDNLPLASANYIFLGGHPDPQTIVVDGKDYTATFLGRADISSWNEKYSWRDFWRLENAYNDFKDCRLTGNFLTENDHPFSPEAGQVYVIDYTLKSGGTQRQVMRCDGDLWEGLLTTYSMVVDAPLNCTEIMTINGKDYTAVYYGRADISSWNEKYSWRDFWRLENAYNDFKDCRLTGEYLPESNYLMRLEEKQVYVIDYTLKTGGMERRMMRCDGDLYELEGRLNTHAFVVTDAPLIRTDVITLNGKDYTARYYGAVDISSWSEVYAYREFWRLEDAYADFKNYSLKNEGLPSSNYPFTIETGQVFVIDYTLKSGGAERRVMRCDGDLWEGMLLTHAVAVDLPPIRTEVMTVNGKNYTAHYYGTADISSSELYISRAFWHLEDAYEDFRDCPLSGEYLPESNYPMVIGAGQVYVIDYTLKTGGTERRLMRCDGEIFEPENGLLTKAFALG